MTVFFQPNEFSTLLAELFCLIPSERAFVSSKSQFSPMLKFIGLGYEQNFLATVCLVSFTTALRGNLSWAHRTWNISMTRQGNHSGDL